MKLITPILIFALIFPATVFADELIPPPTITGVNKGEPAPYTGVLLNSSAAAKIFAEKDYSGLECNLKIDFELSKLAATHALQMKSLQLSLDMSERKYDSIISYCTLYCIFLSTIYKVENVGISGMPISNN